LAVGASLADDARKIIASIREIGALPDVDADNRGWMARDAIALAESLPARIGALEMERDNAIAELRRTDPNYTPLLDKYVMDIEAYFERAEAAESKLALAEVARDGWQVCATEERIALSQRDVDDHRKRIKTTKVFEEMWRSAVKENIDLESKIAAVTKERDALKAVLTRAALAAPAAEKEEE
jgi:hypothetical protein